MSGSSMKSKTIYVLYVCLRVLLPMCRRVRTFLTCVIYVCPFASFPVCLSVCACLPACLSVCLSLCLSPSLCLIVVAGQSGAISCVIIDLFSPFLQLLWATSFFFVYSFFFYACQKKQKKHAAGRFLVILWP